MTRAALAFLLLTPFACLGQTTSTPFTLYVHDTTGRLPDSVLPAAYQLPSTPVGGLSPTVLKLINTSMNTVQFVLALVSTGPNSSVSNPNFSVTGQFQNLILSPGGSLLFNVNFAPTTPNIITGYLNVAYQIQQSGCLFSDPNPTNVCPGNLANISVLSGAASAPQLTLSYTASDGSSVVLQPGSSSPLNFPNTSLSATSTIAFTVTNPTNIDAPAPAISLPPVNSSAPLAFSLNSGSVPTTIAAGQSATFSVTFSPSQAGLTTGVLQVGSNTYPIQGAGIIVASIDSLQISYTDSTGVRTLPQSATPISFGQVVAGSGLASVLTFTVANPLTSSNAVSISGITASGAGFSLANVPAAPISIAPGNSITFSATFTPTSSGTYTGNLAIGTRQFVLNGLSVSSPLPAFSLTLSGQLSSQQQDTVTIHFAAPAAVAALGTITLQFAPLAGLADDPSILFLANASRQLSVAVAASAQTATYADKSGNPLSAIAFQTGTTAGTITFSVAFANTTTYTQSFTIPAAGIQLTSSQAVRQSPNLVVTVAGYDNTYSAGQLSFTFYDTTGKVIGSAIPVNASTNFQQLFFNGNTAGGLFSLSGNFPVMGDVNQVGSVTVGVTNTQGQATMNATFK